MIPLDTLLSILYIQDKNPLFVPTLVASVFWGVLSCFIARYKGRSGWWGLSGFLFHIPGFLFIVVSSDLKKEKELINRIEDLEVHIHEKEFQEATTISDQGDLLCLSCKNFNQTTSICSLFSKEVHTIVTCCTNLEKEIIPIFNAEKEAKNITSS